MEAHCPEDRKRQMILRPAAIHSQPSDLDLSLHEALIRKQSTRSLQAGVSMVPALLRRGREETCTSCTSKEISAACTATRPRTSSAHVQPLLQQDAPPPTVPLEGPCDMFLLALMAPSDSLMYPSACRLYP